MAPARKFQLERLGTGSDAPRGRVTGTGSEQVVIAEIVKHPEALFVVTLEQGMRFVSEDEAEMGAPDSTFIAGLIGRTHPLSSSCRTRSSSTLGSS